MVKPNFLVFMLLASFFGCSDTNKEAEAIAKIEIELKVSRFDKEFAKATPLDIPVLKKAYPYLFPLQYSDSTWIVKMKDSLQIELSQEVDVKFGDFNEESTDLENLFKHLKYYFPKYKAPKVVTVISDVDYANRVILTDTLLLLGLDNYLGKDHKFYRGIQRYIALGLDKEYMVSDVASAFAKRVVPYPKDRSFLSQLIYYGKELYLKDRCIPFKTDAQKIGYTPDKIEWARANEEQVWRYFIEQELLYSTDNKLGLRFLDPAPFSKFQLELDNESPGRIGRYMGWQIVKAFMRNNDLSLQQLMSLSAEEIFRKSNYKPEKSN